MRELLLKAKYLLTPGFELLRDYAVLIRGTRIREIAPSRQFARELESLNLGRAVIMPGMINCHTHLELTNLGRRVRRRKDLTIWLDEARELRNSKTEAQIAQSAREGIEASIRAGVTTVVDHANSGLSAPLLKESGLRAFVLHELVGFDRKLYKKKEKLLQKRLSAISEDRLYHTGIAPHSLYAISDRLMQKCKEIADTGNMLISIHLSEHESELELLQTGAGAFRDHLVRLGADLSKWEPPGVSPVEHLRRLGILSSRSLLVHCNYLGDGDIATIKRHRRPVVYCPRSHFYFYHKPHPFERLLANGIRITLGTDSMVSNWSLSILDEMRFVQETYPAVSAAQTLKLVTADAASALGLTRKVGRLLPGFEADISAVRLPKGIRRTTIDSVLHPESRNIFTMVAGKVLYNAMSKE